MSQVAVQDQVDEWVRILTKKKFCVRCKTFKKSVQFKDAWSESPRGVCDEC